MISIGLISKMVVFIGGVSSIGGSIVYVSSSTSTTDKNSQTTDEKSKIAAIVKKYESINKTIPVNVDLNTSVGEKYEGKVFAEDFVTTKRITSQIDRLEADLAIIKLEKAKYLTVKKILEKREKINTQITTPPSTGIKNLITKLKKLNNELEAFTSKEKVNMLWFETKDGIYTKPVKDEAKTNKPNKIDLLKQEETKTINNITKLKAQIKKQ